MSQPRLRSGSVIVTRIHRVGYDGEEVMRYGRPVMRIHVETDWNARRVERLPPDREVVGG